MKNTFEALQSSWRKSQSAIIIDENKVNLLISSAEAKKRSNIHFYYGNIAVLSATTILLVFVWQKWLPFEWLLSQVGIIIMVCGLILRIVFEIASLIKSNSIRLSDSTAESNVKHMDYYKLRKIIHGPITIGIIAAYLLGYGLTLPELSLYVDNNLLVLFTLAFLVCGVFIIKRVRKNILKEMKNLEFFLTIEKKLNE